MEAASPGLLPPYLHRAELRLHNHLPGTSLSLSHSYLGLVGVKKKKKKKFIPGSKRGSGVWPPPISKENPDSQNSRKIKISSFILYFILG